MPSRASNILRRGDLVVVRAPDEILATLDSRGTLDGLPFMPEMIDHCGRSYRVLRRVEKACVEGDPKLERRFVPRDVVLLEMARCSGDAHGGCKSACTILWKEQWLRRCDPQEATVEIKSVERERLLQRLQTRREHDQYFCQSTELKNATQPFPWKVKAWFPVIAAREVASGDRTLSEILSLAFAWSWRQWHKRARDPVRGRLKRTPSESLGLMPGERVRVKPLEEILATLDHKGRNRGLSISYAMTTQCGVEFEVDQRVDRMIIEASGRLREISDTVTLAGNDCSCWYILGGCPRGNRNYWREIWLERVEPGTPPQ